jgi:hypothetical protein
MKRSSRTIFTLLAVALTVTFILCGCSATTIVQSTPSSTTPPVSASGGIEFKGLGDNPFNISLDKLKEYASTQMDAESLTSDGEIVKMNVKGPTMDEILKEYGKTQKDFFAIRATATDGYVVEIPKDILQAKDVILAYEIDGKTLDAENGPVRLIVNKERALYWAKMVCKIELLQQNEQSVTTRVVILESTYDGLAKEKYEYKTSIDNAVKMEELLGIWAKGENADEYFLTASDGLQKNQQKDIVTKFYLKIDGESAPMLTSAEIPVGMHFKDLLSLKAGSTVFLSVGKMLEGGKTAALTETLKAAGLEGNAFILAATDGYSRQIASSDVENWSVVINQTDGIVCFEKGKEDKGIKHFVSITAK